jgi:hypothetical protein
MLTRSPSEVFIRFLISQREHESNTILRMLEDFRLEGLSSSYIKKLQADMEPFPDPWEPLKKDGPCRDYLKKHNIYDLWFPNGHVKEAYEILSAPQLRADVEQLLLSPLRIEEITQRLNRHHNLSLTIEGVQSFGHYFWNKKLLAVHEWIEYLEERPNAANCVAVSRRMRDIAFLKVLEIERQPATLAHSKMMKNYMDVIKDAENEMRQSDVALKDVLAAFEKFRLRKDNDKIPSIEQVAGPNYSQSGAGTGRSEELADSDFREDDDG